MNFLFSLLIVLLSPQGSYNISTGAIDRCDSVYVCHHEIGHKISVADEGYAFWNWRSADPEFRKYVDENYDRKYPYEEMYAMIFADAGGSGDLPEELWAFYLP